VPNHKLADHLAIRWGIELAHEPSTIDHTNTVGNRQHFIEVLAEQ
jgi:hypothetical protein